MALSENEKKKIVTGELLEAFKNKVKNNFATKEEIKKMNGDNIPIDGNDGSISIKEAIDSKTDKKVNQTKIESDGHFPILFANKINGSAMDTTNSVTDETGWDSGIYVNPSNNTIYATTFYGTATKATNADNDSDGNKISTTYTKTSILPNDNGQIKTKYRISNKGYTGTNDGKTVRYYKLCNLPISNDGNYASAIISGRIGGWTNTDMSYINALLWNRSGPGISLIDIAAGAPLMSYVWQTVDLVLYTNDDNSATIYIKCMRYFTFDINLELYQSTASITYDGTYITEEPSGTLSVSASTSNKRLELVNGKLMVNGDEIAKISSIPDKVSQLTNDKSYTTIDNVNDALVVPAIDECKEYTDNKIADLVNAAPETLDTLGELATAFQENKNVVDALNSAIGSKADDSSVVHKTGSETISGNKTFTGTTAIPMSTLIQTSTNGMYVPGANWAEATPIAKSFWHDLLAFGTSTYPAVQTSTDGSTWTNNTSSDLNKSLFLNKENQKITVIDDNKPYIRWTWTNDGLAWSNGEWVVIGFAYSDPNSTVKITIENSTDGSKWNSLCVNSTNTQAKPVWFKLPSSDYTFPDTGKQTWNGTKYFRITLQRTTTSGNKTLSTIKLLTSRWGDQGKGSEEELPYRWDTNVNIYPRSTSQSLGINSIPWNNIYGTKIYENGTALSNTYAKKTDLSSYLSLEGGTVNGKTVFNDEVSAVEFYEDNVPLSSIYAKNDSVVHNTGNETISGSKTFKSTILVHPDGTGTEGGQIDLHSASGSQIYAGTSIDNYSGYLRIFGIASKDGTSMAGVGTPLTINPYTKEIKGGYTITGNLTGIATRATQDGDGNNIKDTYLKKADLNDTKVNQTKTESDGNFPILFANKINGSAMSTTNSITDETGWDSGIYVNPSNNTIYATTFYGTATKATGDEDGNKIKDNYLSLANINGKYFNSRTYITHHPENWNGSVIPFLYNDLAHLLSKGGSCSIYTTSSTSFTVADLTKVTTISATANLFDGTPSYQNNFSGTLTDTNGDSFAEETLVIDITCHKTFTYSNVIYIDFGNISWYSQNIQVLVMNSSSETAYTSVANITGHTQPAYYCSADRSSTGFNKIRFILKKPKKNLRIAQIGVINYSSSGVAETFLSKAGGSVYGSIYPNSNNGANLGTTNNKWSTIYATNINENGTALSSKYLGINATASSASQVAITNTTPSSAKTYYPVYVQNMDGNQSLCANSDLYYYDSGTWSYFNIGSSNQLGGLSLHQNNGKYANIAPGTLTANRTNTLPDTDGTLINTGNIDSYTVKWWRVASNIRSSNGTSKTIAYSNNLYSIDSGGAVASSTNKPKAGDYIFDTYGSIYVITTVTDTNCTATQRWMSNYAWTCLEEGTLITLSDGTQKSIEELKQGDLLLGYDFENNKTCEAVTLVCTATVEQDNTNYLVFSNGEYLSCTSDHEIYSSTHRKYMFIKDLKEGDKTLNEKGEEIEIYSIHRGIYNLGYKRFYQLVSSNNTYYANNVLNAMHPINKFNWLSYGIQQEIPEEIMKIFKADAEEFSCYEFLVKDKDFLKKSVSYQSNIKTRQNKINELKQRLLDTDYIAIKKSEGLEVDEKIINERQHARNEINKLEEEIKFIYQPAYNNLLVAHSTIGEDILLSNEEKRVKYFFKACKRDNENIELFKKYYKGE